MSQRSIYRGGRLIEVVTLGGSTIYTHSVKAKSTVCSYGRGGAPPSGGYM